MATQPKITKLCVIELGHNSQLEKWSYAVFLQNQQSRISDK